MTTIDLEEGMPRVHEALARLNERLNGLCPSVRAVKLITGYGSTGTGGAIREAVRKSLGGMMEAGQIRDFIPGEHWGKSHDRTVYWLDVLPALSRDGDLGKGNPGITIVILSNPFRSGSALPKVCCPPARLTEELEEQKNRGHVVVKVINPQTGEGATAFTTTIRSLKKTGAVKHFISGDNWKKTDRDTMLWVRKFPQCDSDPDFGGGRTDFFVVFLARRLRTEPTVPAPTVSAGFTSCWKRRNAQSDVRGKSSVKNTAGTLASGKARPGIHSGTA